MTTVHDLQRVPISLIKDLFWVIHSIILCCYHFFPKIPEIAFDPGISPVMKILHRSVSPVFGVGSLLRFILSAGYLTGMAGNNRLRTLIGAGQRIGLGGKGVLRT